MSRRSRDKGANHERAIVNFWRAQGVDAERVPLSGAAKGSYDKDVRIGCLWAEAKIRANGFRELYGWLEHDGADLLVLRADRKGRLYVLPEEILLDLIKQAGGKYVTGHVTGGNSPERG